MTAADWGILIPALAALATAAAAWLKSRTTAKALAAHTETIAARAHQGAPIVPGRPGPPRAGGSGPGGSAAA